MPQRLRVKRIMTVGFVDKGDNPPADLVFWKRKPDETGDSPMLKFWKAIAEKLGMKPDEVDKLLADAGADGGGDNGDGATGDVNMTDLEKLQAQFDELKESTDALEKRAKDAEAKVEELEKAAAGNGDGDGDGSGDPPELPEEVQKQMTDLEKRAVDAESRVQKLEDDAANKEYIAKARGYSDLPGMNPDDFGTILRKIDDALEPDERTTFHEMLKSSAAVAKLSPPP